MVLAWPDKDPDEVLDYKLNWSKRLSGDTIFSSTFEIVTGSTDLVIDSNSFTDTATTIWLSGGLAGETVAILNRIVTAGDRTMDQTVYITITSR